MYLSKLRDLNGKIEREELKLKLEGLNCVLKNIPGQKCKIKIRDRKDRLKIM